MFSLSFYLKLEEKYKKQKPPPALPPLKDGPDPGQQVLQDTPPHHGYQRQALLEHEQGVHQAEDAQAEREDEDDHVVLYSSSDLDANNVAEAEDASEDGHPQGSVLGRGCVGNVWVEADIEAHVTTS